MIPFPNFAHSEQQIVPLAMRWFSTQFHLDASGSRPRSFNIALVSGSRPIHAT
jgi:hypothetical protein